MKPWHLWVSIAAILAGGFLLSQDALARLVWHRFSRPDLALPLNRRDANLAMRLGSYYFNGGAYDLEKAERAYRRAMEIDPATPLAHYQLGRIRFLKGDFTAATRYVNRELELHPEIPNAFYVRGLIGGYSGLYAQAEADFKEFITREPRVWAGYNDLAWVQAKQGKFRETKNTVLLAFERLPGERTRNIWLWTSLGVAHLNVGEYTQAKEAFRTALDMTKTISAEQFWGAYPGNDPRQAGEAYRQFLAALHFNLGLAHKGLGELGAAKTQYESSKTLSPETDYHGTPDFGG